MGIFRCFLVLILFLDYPYRVANTQRQYMEWTFTTTWYENLLNCNTISNTETLYDCFIYFLWLWICYDRSLIFLSYTDVAFNTAKVFDVIDDFELEINQSEQFDFELQCRPFEKILIKLSKKCSRIGKSKVQEIVQWNWQIGREHQ